MSFNMFHCVEFSFVLIGTHACMDEPGIEEIAKGPATDHWWPGVNTPGCLTRHLSVLTWPQGGEEVGWTDDQRLL